MADSRDLTKRQRYEILRAQLDQERSTFTPQWRDCGDYILPTRPRFFVSDVNKGNRKNQKIINSRATTAVRTLSAGMTGGITSPARPWFRLSTPDPDLAEFGSVKRWLHLVSDRMATVFLRSNLYNTLPTLYGDVATFATSPMSLEEDLKTTIHTQSFPVGSYMIAKDRTGKVNVFFREFRMTVRQLVEEFGEYDHKTGRPMWDNFSTYVRTLWDRGNYETWIDVCHVIAPNSDYNRYKSHSKHKAFTSCYYERGSTGSNSSGNYMGDQDTYLRESGYDKFPILCPRWEVTGEDVYGTNCPGFTALGDIKALQTMEKRKAQAIEKMINPAMVAPTSFKNQKTSLLPGDVTFGDVREGMQGFRPAHEVNIRIAELTEDIRDHEARISKVFFEDLFLMLAESDRRQITATEIDERKEEKLLALGPVLERMNQDLLDPLIENTFDIMLAQGQIPEPPEELGGMDLKVEYISMMAQAQKLIGIGGLDRLWTLAERMAPIAPTSLVKINTDKYIEIYAENCGVNPSIIRTDDEADAIREHAAQAQAAQAQAEQMQATTQAAKNLSQADLGGDNALNALLSQAKAGNLVPGGN